MPPNRPRGTRRASTIASPTCSHSAARARIGSSLARLRGETTGSSPWRPVFAAVHAPASGHSAQRGVAGAAAHSVAPSSIKPWFRSPGAASAGSAAISAPACSHSARWPAVDLMSCVMPSTRASTRATLPSTSGARSPYAIDAIAPAVYGPMPGTPRSSLARRGSAPSGRATTYFAPAWRLRARE